MYVYIYGLAIIIMRWQCHVIVKSKRNSKVIWKEKDVEEQQQKKTQTNRGCKKSKMKFRT